MQQPLQLGPLEHIAGYHIAQAAVLTTQTFEAHIGGPFELRKVEFSLLMLLLANKDPSPKQLSRALALTSPHLTLLLDKLQQRGLITRERNPSDGRSQRIVLTEAGQQLSRATAAAALPMEEELRGRLSKAEHAMLVELLGKLAPGAVARG